jgi:hypothetical protein
LLKEQYPEDLQLDEARKLLEQRMRSKSKKKTSTDRTAQRRNRRNDTTDAMRYLASRGFSRYVIIQALKRL